MKRYDIVVVGAGQAGLAIGYFLEKDKRNFVLLDGHEQVGDTWRNRYDSLVLFTPRKYSALPGLEMESSAEGFPTKDEMADYLTQYAAHYDLPIQLRTKVMLITKEQQQFHIETDRGMIGAKKVIIASGAFQKPFIPPVVKNNDQYKLIQMHSSQYRAPEQLRAAATLAHKLQLNSHVKVRLRWRLAIHLRFYRFVF